MMLRYTVHSRHGDLWVLCCWSWQCQCLLIRRQLLLATLDYCMYCCVLLWLYCCRYWGLEPGLAIGVALVSCMPGGTASNIVAFIARGDMVCRLLFFLCPIFLFLVCCMRPA